MKCTYPSLACVKAILATSAALSGIPVSVWADGLPKATYSQALRVQAAGNGNYRTKNKAGALTLSTSYSHEGSYGTAKGTQDITVQQFATATSSGSTSGNVYTFVNGYSILTYYFAVVGPKVASVPVIVTISGSLSSAKNGGSFASIQITNVVSPSGTFVQYGCGYGAPTTVCGAYSTPITVNVAPTEKPNASNAATVQINCTDEVYSGNAMGSISATIQIDPSYSGASSYKIVASNGVGF